MSSLSQKNFWEDFAALDITRFTLVLKSHTAISRAPQTEKAAVLGGIWVQIAKTNDLKKPKNPLYLDSPPLRQKNLLAEKGLC